MARVGPHTRTSPRGSEAGLCRVIPRRLCPGATRHTKEFLSCPGRGRLVLPRASLRAVKSAVLE